MRQSWRNLLRSTTIRYVVAGIGCNLLLLALYYGLTFGLAINPNLALTIAAAVVFPIAFFVSRAWTFASSAPTLIALAQYGAFYLSGWLLQSAILLIGVRFVGAPHYIVAPVGLGIAALAFYLAQRFIVFSRR